MQAWKRLTVLGIVLMTIISAFLAFALPFTMHETFAVTEPLSSVNTFGHAGSSSLNLQPSDFTVRSEVWPISLQTLFPTRWFVWLPSVYEIALFILLCTFCVVPYSIESLCFFTASCRFQRAPPDQA